MKRTAKYVAALAAARKAGIAQPDFPVQEVLYEHLIALGYAWNAHAGEWAPTKRPIRPDGVESVSMFTNNDGQASGLYRLRVMAHPDVLDAIVAELRSKLDVVEVSDRAYPNRRGEGYRVYLAVKRGKQ